MKGKIFISVIFTFLNVILCNAGITADDIVSNVINKYETSKSMTAAIDVASSNANLKGTITMQGKCFSIITPDLKTWYDGKTQWSYSTQVEEVNITEPSEEELQTSNPYTAIIAFKDKYKGTVLKTDKVNEFTVRFTPKTNDFEIAEVRFTVNKTNWVIKSITLITNEGDSFTTTITNSVYGKKFPKSAFQFNKDLVPANTPINDLR